MRFLKTNTAVIVTVGPFYDKTDGVTIEGALTITNERITLTADTDAGSAPTNILDNVTGATSGTANDLNYITGNDAGMMQLELAAADVNRLGRMFLSITDAANHVPVFHEFMVLPAAIFDWLILGTIVPLPANVTQWLGSAAATPTVAGVPEVDVTHWIGSVPSALVSGRVDSSVGAMAASVLTATAIATDAITAAKIAPDAIGASELAADAVTEIQAGLATAAALTVIDDFLDTEIAAILAAVDTEIAAVLAAVGDASFGIIDAGTAQSATATTLVLRAAAAFANDEIIGATVVIVSATAGAGQARVITDYVGASDTATVDTWTTTPTGTIVYKIFASAPSSASSPIAANVTQWLGTAVAAPSVSGVPEVDLTHVAGATTNVSTLPASVAAILVDTGTTLDGRIPAALVSGRMDSSVGAMAANVVTATAINADAITAAKIADGAIDAATFAAGAINAAAIAADAIGASELAADAIAEIADAVWDEAIAGHLGAGSTGNALNAAGSAGDPWSTPIPGAYGAGTAGKILGDNVNATISSRASQASLDVVDDLLDTEVAAIKTETASIQADTNDIQTRLPAALVSGRMDASVGAMAANVMTAAAAAADLTTELQSGLATASALTVVDDFLDTEVAAILAAVDTEVAAIKAKTDNLPASPASTGDVAAVAAHVDTEVAAILADTTQIKADLPTRITRNVALNAFTFFMVDSTDHVSGKTGLTVAAERSLDGAAFAACANAVTEIANGFYKIDLAAADLNAVVAALKFTAPGADVRAVTIVTQP